MSFGIPVRNGLAIGLLSSTTLSSRRGLSPAMYLNFLQPFLDSRITFSRGSNATLVDSTGKITYAPANLLLRSEEFDNAAWTTAVGTATITANADVAPDGTNTADTFAATSANATRWQTFLPIVGGNYVFSIWLKRRTGTGVVEITTDAVNFTPVAVTSVWQRFSVTALNLPAGTKASGVRVVTSGDAVDVWGAQLEPVTYQTTPGPYVATTSAAYYGPRFDYDPVTLAPKGLLIEEARTNLALQSQTFDNAYWTKNDTTVTADATVSPDGATNADKLVETATTAVHKLTGVVTTTNTNPLTLSCYLKAGERTSAALVLQEGSPFSRYSTVTFNLSAGTASAVTEVGGASASSATITPAGNGWYRCTLTTTLGGAATSSLPQVVLGTNLTPYLGVAGNGAFIWGAQLEAGAFATSYIPTVASTVTRSADVATMTGTNFSSWYNQTEGSFAVDASIILNSGNRVWMDVGPNGGFGTTAYIQQTSTTIGLLPASPPVNMGSTVATTTLSNKVAIGLQNNNSIIAVSGVLGTLDTSCAVPASATQLVIGSAIWSLGGAISLNGWVRQIAYYNTRLPNSQLQTLTAPSLGTTLSLSFTNQAYTVGV